MLNLVKECNFVRVKNSVGASQTTLATSIVDMGEPLAAGGYDSIAFVVLLGTVSSGSVLTATVQDNTANSSSGMTNVTAAAAQIFQQNSANATVVQSSANAGLVFTDVATGSSNEFFVIDVRGVQNRYVRLNCTIATANCAFDGVLAILYRSKTPPVVQDTSCGGYGLFVASS